MKPWDAQSYARSQSLPPVGCGVWPCTEQGWRSQHHLGTHAGEDMFLSHGRSPAANQVLKYMRNNVLFKIWMPEREREGKKKE